MFFKIFRWSDENVKFSLHGFYANYFAYFFFYFQTWLFGLFTGIVQAVGKAEDKSVFWPFIDMKTGGYINILLLIRQRSWTAMCSPSTSIPIPHHPHYSLFSSNHNQNKISKFDNSSKSNFYIRIVSIFES